MMNKNLSFFKGKRIFITGHTGFKGSWLCFILDSLGAELFGYSLSPNPHQRLFKHLKIENKVNSVFGDIRDLEKLEKVMRKCKPDIVIHMAAQPLVRYSYSNPIDTYSTNVMGTANLMEACRVNPSIKVILNITTDKVYENKEWLWAYREDERLGGYDPYSSSKACSELITSAYVKSFFNPSEPLHHKARISTARAGNVIGGGDWSEDRLIPDIINSLTKNEEVLLRNPHSIRPWQHVFEPLFGYLTLIKKMYDNGSEYTGHWNFGPDDKDVKTVGYIANLMSELWGVNSPFSVNSTPQPHEAKFLKLDCSKAKSLLNWHPKWTTDKALEEIVLWHKAQLNREDLEKVSIEMLERYLS
jgi:CDP-glucose 4,6-dehydratase